MKKFNDYRKKADPEEIRKVGYQFSDMIAEYMQRIQNEDGKVVEYIDPETAYALYDEPMPQDGIPLDEALSLLRDPFLKFAQNLASPMYMGHQVCHPMILSSFAKLLASAVNQGLAIQEMSPTGTMIEKRVIRWLCDAIGWDAFSDGTVVSGGTEANLTGILVARTAKFGEAWKEGVHAPMVGFCSARSHYSIERAFGILGLGTENLIKIPEEQHFHMDVTALRQAIAQARREGKIPFTVIATAGCTPVGEFDEIEKISKVCKDENLWLHIDGAHGGSFVISPKLKHLLKGIELADSVALDPHKMLFMPLNFATILFKRTESLDATFKINAPYIFHKTTDNLGCINIGERTIQCSRSLEAIKLWLCLKHYGAKYFASMQEHCVEMTTYLYRQMQTMEDFETLHKPAANILCFRHIPVKMRGQSPEAIDDFNYRVRTRLNRSGKAWITTTVFAGKRLLRTTIINPRTEREHINKLLNAIWECGQEELESHA